MCVRQGKRKEREMPTCGNIKVNGVQTENCGISVSYTHLDVYKRQGRTNVVKERVLAVPDTSIFIAELPEATRNIIRKDLEEHARERCV